MAERIAAANSTHAWLVLEDEGRVVGYAYGVPFHRRAAYRWACEVSVYVEPGRRRTGAGRLLYEALLARLTERAGSSDNRVARIAPAEPAPITITSYLPWAARSTVMISTGWCGCAKTLVRAVTSCTVKCQSQTLN